MDTGECCSVSSIMERNLLRNNCAEASSIGNPSSIRFERGEGKKNAPWVVSPMERMRGGLSTKSLNLLGRSTPMSSGVPFCSTAWSASQSSSHSNLESMKYRYLFCNIKMLFLTISSMPLFCNSGGRSAATHTSLTAGFAVASNSS